MEEREAVIVVFSLGDLSGEAGGYLSHSPRNFEQMNRFETERI